jgi:hypothetical protein
MNQNRKEYHRKKTAFSDSFLIAVGKAAEQEMLRECEIWENEAGELKIPENVEAQILELARKHEKKYLNRKRNHADLESVRNFVYALRAD